MTKIDHRLKEVYGAAGERDTLDRLYDDWSDSYDRDLWATGNPYIAITAAMVARHLRDFDSTVLDAGCGTGLLGQLLHQIGYRNLEGLDASSGMLAEARRNGCYRDLHQLLLGPSVDLPDNRYDAVTAAGVLTHGHAPADSLDGLVALAKPGAAIVFSISEVAMAQDGFGDKIGQLDESGAWQLTERTEPFDSYPFSETHAQLQHWVCVYRKSA